MLIKELVYRYGTNMLLYEHVNLVIDFNRGEQCYFKH